jgi:hypothetical protein
MFNDWPFSSVLLNHISTFILNSVRKGCIISVAFHKKLRIAHVEAGLRTFNMYSPFPEEFNRKTISSMATYHFAPTENNRRNLLNILNSVRKGCIISACCPVNIVVTTNLVDFLSSWITGDILITSGRVPKNIKIRSFPDSLGKIQDCCGNEECKLLFKIL